MAARANVEREALKGLASEWEVCSATRRRLLLDNYLLKWPKPELTGVPSYASVSLNFESLEPLFRLWAASVPAPKSPRVTSLLAEVKAVWNLIGQKSTKGEIQCDAWGFRKFLSFFIKRLAQTTKPRDKGNRKLKKILLEAWYPDRVSELLTDDEEDANVPAAEADDEDYEHLADAEDPEPEEDPDVVAYVNGRLDNEDEDDEPSTDEVLGHSNEAEGSSAEPPTVEVPGHISNAGAENEVSSAEPPTLEVSGHIGNARAENEDSSAKQPTQVSGHTSGNSAVLASTAEASAQPELILCSDEEAEVPKRPIPTPARARATVSQAERLSDLKHRLLQLKQKKGEIAKATFRRDAPLHCDPSRVETQTYDIEAVAERWQNPGSVDGVAVDLETQETVASEASGSSGDSDKLPPKKLPDLEAVCDPEPSESRGVHLARAKSFAERAQSYDTKAVAAEVLTKEKQDARMEAAKAKEDAKPGHGRGGRGRGGRGRGGRGRGKTPSTGADEPEPEQANAAEPTQAQPSKGTKNAKKHVSDPAEPTEAQPPKRTKRTKDAKQSASPTEPTKKTKDAKESAPPSEPTEAKPEESASATEPTEAKPEESTSPTEPTEAKPRKRTKGAEESASPAEPKEAKPRKRTKDAEESASPAEPKEAQAPKPRRGRAAETKDAKSEEPPKPKRSAPAKEAAEQTESQHPKAKRNRTTDAKENVKPIEAEAAKSDKKAQQARRKAIRDGLDMPVYSFVDIDFYWSRNGMGVKLRDSVNVEEQGKQVLYLGYKGVAEHTAMITMWKFARPAADLVEKAKGHLTPALVAKLAAIKENFANRAEV